MNILPIHKIKAEAEAAAKTSSNVNDCCPYPFGTDAGRTYRAAFEAACKAADDAVSARAAAGITHALITVSGWTQ
jgi:hypothetical protein